MFRKLALLKRITDGSLGARPSAAEGFRGLGESPQAVGRFFVIFWKKSYFNAIESKFASVQSHLKTLDF